ncbi:hypothetical protein BT63DRAFT_461030 [Microthyrium microscopicum]|uniref:Uncharacterized protein n=1 Tax=Microthyrium microscopicum TaxID=703497 RepID=A0A6A6TVS9_9PEZI|nr:hypothetical protein BT63DRAFT_461030 [Microthyrium microscopicum]
MQGGLTKETPGHLKEVDRMDIASTIIPGVTESARFVHKLDAQVSLTNITNHSPTRPNKPLQYKSPASVILIPEIPCPPEQVFDRSSLWWGLTFRKLSANFLFHFSLYLHWYTRLPDSDSLNTMRLSIPLFAAALLAPSAFAGPAAYGICQAGCAAVVAACYAAAGATFGVAPPVAIPALAACNTAFGTCQAACWAALLLPTP